MPVNKKSVKRVPSMKKDTVAPKKYTKEMSLRMTPKQLDNFISKTSKAGGNVQKALDAKRAKVVRDSTSNANYKKTISKKK